MAFVSVASEQWVGLFLAPVAFLLGQSMSNVAAEGALWANPSIERATSGALRAPTVAAHVER
jgi:nucleoside permease NupC